MSLRLFLSYLLIFICTYSCLSQNRKRSFTFEQGEAVGRQIFVDGYLIHSGKDRLHITSFLEKKVDTFSVDISGEKMFYGAYMTERKGDTLLLSGYYGGYRGHTQSWNYVFDFFKIYDKKLHKLSSVSMPYALNSERHYILPDEKTALSFASGKTPYFTHFSMTRGREVYQTPSLPYVKNPAAKFFSYDSNFSKSDNIAVFMMRESGGTKAHFCLHAVTENTPLIFVEDIEDFPPGWRTHNVIYADGNIYIHGMGYTDFAAYEKSDAEKKYERIYELNVRTRALNFLEMNPVFKDKPNRSILSRRAKFYQIKDATYLVYTYQIPTEITNKRLQRQVILQLNTDDFSTKVILDEQSPNPKSIYLFGDKKLEITTDRSKGYDEVKRVCRVSLIQNTK